MRGAIASLCRTDEEHDVPASASVHPLQAGRLSGKVALVTGAAAGIGQGCALLFAAQGAAVIGCDIDSAAAERTEKLAQERGLDLHMVHPCDMTDPAGAQRFVDEAITLHGRIDVLVTAGAIPPHMALAAEMDFEEQWTPTLHGEIDVAFLPCQAAWPHMKTAGGGSIINFASVNAFRGSSNFGMIAHCAGKSAVLGLTRQLAVEGGPLGIRANTISPGMVRTPATESAGAHEGGKRDALLARIPLGRVGTPEDIAWCALYLASDEAAWMTGAAPSPHGVVSVGWEHHQGHSWPVGALARRGQAARLKGLDAGITAGTVPRRWHAGSRRPAALRDRRAKPAADAAAGRVPSKIIRPPLTWPGGQGAAPAARQIQVVDGSARAVRAGEADARPLRPEQGATTIAATPCSGANPRSPAPTTLRVNTPSRWNGRRTRSRRWPPACCWRRRRPSG
jgi:NAD(P)-dependent dehydrogenase (short-subunit alcohol dehydrogenase family)